MNFISDLIFSSTGEGISLRLKSAIAFIVAGAAFFGFATNVGELSAVIDAVGKFVAAIAAIISAVTYIRAHIRFVFNRDNNIGRFRVP